MFAAFSCEVEIVAVIVNKFDREISLFGALERIPFVESEREAFASIVEVNRSKEVAVFVVNLGSYSKEALESRNYRFDLEFSHD